MTAFINYSINTGLSLSSSRNPQATVCDIAHIAEAMRANTAADLVCAVDDETQHMIEEEGYFKGSDVTLFDLETIIETLSEFFGA